MANDKLINHTQGETIITKLTSIADALDDLSAISPAKFGMGLAVTNTPASTAAKTANIANFILTEGGEVNITFTYANTASNATLNINNTGAKPILYKGSPITADIISAGDTCTFIYSSANGGSYNIINIDALSGAGAGTVKSVGASTGLKTDQTSGAAINITGTVKLDLTSETPFEGTAPAPVEIEDKIYPVALDAAGHPAVSVPGTEYTQGVGINISENNVITNTGVFDVTTPTSSDTTATNGDIKVIKKVVNNGVTTESATFVKPKGINDPAFKSLDSSTSGLTSDDNHVPTSKTVQDAIDTALASASIYKGTISAFNDLPTSTPTDTVRKGWYYRVSTAWSAATGTPATHVGDIIIAEKDSPSKAIDSANWSLLHNEANTDANVTQSPVSTNANYEVLFSGSADNTSHTEGTGKDSGLTYNPSTNKLTVSGEVSASSYSGLPDGNTTTKGIVQLGTDADKAASGSHGHGNITNGGALQTTDVAIASGDKLVITDASDSNKVARASVSFDGSTATQALTKKGTFENFQAPISASNKLSSDLVDDTNKTHKFATADQLTQIATNKTNILYAIEHGQKNQLNFDGWATRGTGVTWKLNDDKTITATGTATNLNYIVLQLNGSDVVVDSLCDGLHFLSGCPSGGDFDSKYSMYVSKGSYTPTDTGSGVVLPATSETGILVVIRISSGFAIPSGGLLFKPMICLKAVYDVYPEYQQFGAPNSDLTGLQAEDRASLVEVVDSGAKNELKPSWTTQTINGVTFTVGSDGVITATTTGTRTSAAIYPLLSRYSGTKMTGKVMSISPSGGTNASYYVAAEQADSPWHNVGTDYGNGVVISSEANNKDINVNIVIAANYSPNSLKFYPMICTKAAFDISKAFVPYRYDPYTTVWQNVANATLYARRNGRTVTINGYVDNLSFTSGTALTLGTINDEIGKPVQQIRALCNIGSNAYSIGEVAYLTVGTDGLLKVTPKTYSGTGAVFLSFVYAF